MTAAEEGAKAERVRISAFVEDVVAAYERLRGTAPDDPYRRVDEEALGSALDALARACRP